MTNRTVLLLIFDGWGIRPDVPGNAITMVRPPHYEGLLDDCPMVAIEASGEAVGLPDGQMGNSEVGHLNLGAGRVVYQDLTRINKSIRDGDFFQNPVLLDAINHAKQNNGTLHLMGLVSDGGVHSSLDHLDALLQLAQQQQLDRVRVHAFLDGRDVPPKSAKEYLARVEEKLLGLNLPQIATISGRYYAMDRDNRWERVQKAYDCLVSADGIRYPFSIDALEAGYNNGETDEFILPCVTDFTYEGMKDGDSIFFFNFRPDRARQLTRALAVDEFAHFDRPNKPKNVAFASMSPYDASFTFPIAYTKQPMDNLLCHVVSNAGIKQFRTAETEKYAHVTYFFNGGIEEPVPGEARSLVPSPKVATYDLQPHMSIQGVTENILQAIESGEYGLIVANFANPDMVGHTGKLNPAMDAVRAVDECLGKIVSSIRKHNGVMLLTADHGNIEKMIDDDGGEHTAHTTDPVPLVLVSNDPSLDLARDQGYALSNISPTILELMGLPIPAEMTAPSMLVRKPVMAEAN